MKQLLFPLLLTLTLLTGCAGTGAAAPEDPIPPSPEVSAPAEEPSAPAEPDEPEHQPADEPLVTAEPDMLYCGNTVTTITVDGTDYSFWGDDSVVLTDLLLHLVYDPDAICRCPPEYKINTEFGSGYGVNLTNSYARSPDGQVSLTEEQVDLIQAIIDRNCTPDAS